MSTFSNKSQQRRTELSNYIQELKVNDKDYIINLVIVVKAHSNNFGTRKCEKFIE